MTPLAVTAYTLVSALGHGRGATLAALRAGTSGLAPKAFESCRLETWIGAVDAADTAAVPDARWDCRNHRLAALGLAADGFAAAVRGARERWGAARVGVFVGTSTSGILSTEIAYRERDAASGALPPWFDLERMHDNAAVARFVAMTLELSGPALVVSTACSSSAKVYAQAARWIALGLVDAAVVGGVDSLCLTTLYGFNSLELLSREPCRPWDAARSGLSLGEAAAFTLLERDAAAPLAYLLGCGESSDGHHMSSPHPDGAGAVAAMREALADAGLAPRDVDHLNLHGTGTHGNDAAEDRAVVEVFGRELPCSATKSMTGHTLGAAGAVEAAVTLLALQHGILPGTVTLRTRDPALQARVVVRPLEGAPRVAASNSFGFGGSNACLIFGAAR